MTTGSFEMTEAYLQILYEDDALIAINKPTGMFVHRSAADRSETSFVLQLVRDKVGAFVYPVHRLDRATSGIVLLAKTTEVAAILSQMFANRLIAKTYRALVRGHCDESGVVDIPLISARGRDKPEGHPFRAAQEAVTEFNMLTRYEIPMVSDRYPTTRCALLEVRPVTGRYHQIRRHFNYISHPVIGDTSHGDTRQNRFFSSQFGCDRLMLAAISVKFPHPLNQADVHIECRTGDVFEAVLHNLERWRCDNHRAE
jgi:tRNA pseudouridine65 synthase